MNAVDFPVAGKVMRREIRRKSGGRNLAMVGMCWFYEVGECAYLLRTRLKHGGVGEMNE